MYPKDRPGNPELLGESRLPSSSPLVDTTAVWAEGRALGDSCSLPPAGGRSKGALHGPHMTSCWRGTQTLTWPTGLLQHILQQGGLTRCRAPEHRRGLLGCNEEWGLPGRPLCSEPALSSALSSAPPSAESSRRISQAASGRGSCWLTPSLLLSLGSLVSCSPVAQGSPARREDSEASPGGPWTYAVLALLGNQLSRESFPQNF